MEKIRREYRFYGRVQGVGFRYYTNYAAQQLGLTGWVRNSYDGSVEAQAQGSERALSEFVSMIENGRYIRIDSWDCREIPVEEGERGFRIRQDY